MLVLHIRQIVRYGADIDTYRVVLKANGSTASSVVRPVCMPHNFEIEIIFGRWQSKSRESLRETIIAGMPFIWWVVKPSVPYSES
jgi:hypothetical protein